MRTRFLVLSQHKFASNVVEKSVQYGLTADRDIFGEGDPPGVEAQLRRGRELVDVLAARAGGAHEADLDVVFVD